MAKRVAALLICLLLLMSLISCLPSKRASTDEGKVQLKNVKVMDRRSYWKQIRGEVENVGKVPVSDICVIATVYDESGNVIAEESKIPEASWGGYVVPPTASIKFKIDIFGEYITEKFDHYELEVEWKTQD